MKDMKKFMNLKVIGYGLWVMVALLVSAPVTAQNAQEWQTSTMVGSGSTYSPQVNAVGATTASEMATTTSSYSPAKAPSGPRKIGDASGRNPGDVSTGSDQSPVGDAVLPLLLLALTYAFFALRRKARKAA